MNCANCPIAEPLICPGLATRRFCELVDPAHKDYRPAYRETLQKLADGTTTGTTMMDPCCGGSGSIPGILGY